MTVPLNRATPAQVASFRAGQHRIVKKPVPTTKFVTSTLLRREDGFELQLPIKTEASNANGNRHIAHRKRTQQFDATLAACQTQLKAMDRERVIAIELTRIGPRPLDAHDNLRQAFKHVVDAVCAYIARGEDFDDSDRRRVGVFDDRLIGTGKVSCRYDQVTHELDKRLHGIRIRFRLRPS